VLAGIWQRVVQMKATGKDDLLLNRPLSSDVWTFQAFFRTEVSGSFQEIAGDFQKISVQTETSRKLGANWTHV